MPFLSSQDEMFTQSFSPEQQRELATKLTSFLSQFRHLSDSYIIEFFTEDLWQTLPSTWQSALKELSFPQIADLLLDASCKDRRYPSVWPLSLLAFRATAHALAFPREDTHNQDTTLGLKHVKPKKQHEIRKLGTLVTQICDRTGCNQVVDVGSGQGHLTRFLSYGLGLSVTAIEAEQHLVSMASKYTFPMPESPPRHIVGWVDPNASWKDFLRQLQSSHCVNQSPPTFGPHKKKLKASKLCPHGASRVRGFELHSPASFRQVSTRARNTSVACCYMKITTKDNPTPPGLVQRPGSLSPVSPVEFGYPMSDYVRGLPGHQLSYKAREGSCHAIEDYMRRSEESRDSDHQEGSSVAFTEYARLGLPRVGLPPDLPLDPARVEAMLEHQGRVVVFFSLALLLAPVVESLVLLDRIIYLQENGVDSQLFLSSTPIYPQETLSW
ncbi:hypothetical protein WMY93_026570 [Mugilogobius chulae]|uniref:Methyltransferase domain-containing protein n=1 Tax=Mugilogobius chulae TaxID=88201 RepID=A0AAW0MYV4_9GOBI